MTRRLAILASAAALALVGAGCGGGGSGADSPLDEALGYFPDDAPLVVAVSTDLDGDQYRALGKIAKKFPFGGQAIQSLESSVERNGISFDKDVKPLLGNELVFGVADAKALQEPDTKIVGALETKDGDKLRRVAEKDSKELGKEGNATLYESGGSYFAVEGDAIVFGETEGDVRNAVKQRDEDDRLREDEVDAALEGLPGDGLARVYGNLEAILEADPSTASARKLDWIDALTTFGAVLSVSEEGAKVDFAVHTNGQELSADELPIAAGDAAPPVAAAPDEIGVGIRNPAQVLRFAERAAQAVNPSGFAQFQTAKQQLSERFGIDLERDLIDQLTGDLSVAFALDGSYAIRAQVKDPRALEATLRKLVRVIPDFARGAGFGDVGVAAPRRGEDFYAVAERGGGSIVYGVVDDVFVLSNDARRAGRLATEQPRAVGGAKGALVVHADAEQLANRIVARLGGGAQALGASLFTGPLGELTGSIAAEPGGLRGSFTLTID